MISQLDINKLLECGRTTHGFVDNSLRRKIWPIVLNLKDSHLLADESTTEKVRKLSDRSLHRKIIDKDTIRKDADRSFVNIEGINEDLRYIFRECYIAK